MYIINICTVHLINYMYHHYVFYHLGCCSTPRPASKDRSFNEPLWRGADQELHQAGIEAETQSFVDLAGRVETGGGLQGVTQGLKSDLNLIFKN